MIAIVDYGLGNVHSVRSALDYLGFQSRITNATDALRDARKLILPGVGSFRVAMENIRGLGLDEIIHEHVANGRPLLGICLGMQLLGTSGVEDGETNGLGLIAGRVERLQLAADIPIPHIGFNLATFAKRSPLFQDLSDNSADFYFVHSYCMRCLDEADVTAWCMYGERFVASVQRGNVFGTQFHPEKSQANGLRVLKNFAELP